MLYDRAALALQRLPATPGGVADFLLDRGVTGVRDVGCACPLARWLRAELVVPFVSVDIDSVTVIDDQGNVAGLPATPGVTAFVAAFDHDKLFPELVDENGTTDEEEWEVVNIG